MDFVRLQLKRNHRQEFLSKARNNFQFGSGLHVVEFSILKSQHLLRPENSPTVARIRFRIAVRSSSLLALTMRSYCRVTKSTLSGQSFLQLKIAGRPRANPASQ